MPKFASRRREFKAFRFRRRHDHFLRYKLSGAKPNEIIDTARELGFNLNLDDFHRKKPSKASSSKRLNLLSRLISLLKV